ncbi:sensor histidine kinase [Filimonas lacunae]|nr:histidine kinase [Filimonas lacunae]
MKTRVNTILIHFLFLAVFFYAPIVLRPDFAENIMPQNWQMIMIVNNMLAVMVFYVNYYLLIPRFVFHRRYFSYIIYALSMVASGLFLPSLINLIFSIFSYPISQSYSFHLIAGPLIIMFGMSFALAFALRFSGEWQRMRQEKAEMQNEMRTAELMSLKKQLNPHFFFNTLNGIYAMIIKNSPLASKAVLHLSNMMRYVLYDSDCNSIELSREVKYIVDYIEMQKMRISDNNHVHFSVSGELTDTSILPLIFIPFVENAFKYGISADDETSILITIERCPESLIFTCKNDVVAHKNQTTHSGIGIKNTRKRLEMTYPRKHELHTLQLVNKFLVTLNIDLSC